ncbi:MAG: tellurite resistance protein TerA [Pseudonocardiales bacterium]|jgi:tellurite resistance protein TerA|nr:tellurite resistance protein TerA [Pseudonocardiales bacterium]
MPIDYTKRPSQPAPQADPAAAGAPAPAPAQVSAPSAPVSLGKVTLTKAAPSVSLTKQGSAGGMLRVNLNWDARPPGSGGGGGFLKRLTAQSQSLDLDLGCLYEFADGTKGVVQALGNSFTARPRGVHENVIWLDGDDRSGAKAGGENLFVNLSYASQIRRILVFALIYEGAANWAAADAVVTLYPATGPEVEVRLDDPRDGARICAIAMLESNGGELTVRREINYINGGQRLLDEAYGWGMNWTAGRK